MSRPLLLLLSRSWPSLLVGNRWVQFAKHHETGETLPTDLFNKLCAQRTYMAGSTMLRQLYFGQVCVRAGVLSVVVSRRPTATCLACGLSWQTRALLLWSQLVGCVCDSSVSFRRSWAFSSCVACLARKGRPCFLVAEERASHVGASDAALEIILATGPQTRPPCYKQKKLGFLSLSLVSCVDPSSSPQQ